MKAKPSARLFIAAASAAIYCVSSSSHPVSAQQNLGTAVGIPTSSPGVLWPRGSSLESLGFGRLYPNGPEFGLSNTSGGFGLTGAGRVSGVGLAERVLPGLAEAELERPYSNMRILGAAFQRESIRSSTILGTAMSINFRTQIQLSSFYSSALFRPVLTQPYALPSVDAILHDNAASTDAILGTGGP